MSVDQALSLLWQAARPSPPLREAVELVEKEISELRQELRSHIPVDEDWECEECDRLLLGYDGDRRSNEGGGSVGS